MANSQFTSAVIRGITSVVPSNIRTFAEDSKKFDLSEKQLARIKKNIGLDQRRVTDEKTTALDLSRQAAESLLAGLKVDKGTIDGLIFVTQTPDHFQPSNAAICHGQLGLETNCASFDVGLGCSGWVYGLWLAHMMVDAGGCSRVLLLAGDTLSKCVNPRDRSVGPLFGDCGTATLIETSADSNRTYFSLHSDGSGSEHIKIPAGGFRLRPSPETAMERTTDDGNVISDNNLQMNGGEVFNFSVGVEPKAIEEILEYSATDKEQIDYIVFHQANKYIISNITRRLKIPTEKAPMSTVEKYGNQSSASIPCTINDVLAQTVTSEPTKVIMSGFGVGLSWASCLTTLRLDYCPQVITYKEN